MDNRSSSSFGSQSVLGYCTNVYPGTSVPEILDRIGTNCLYVKENVRSAFDFGIGLWLSRSSVQAFRKKDNLEKLKAQCRESKIKVFSWNAFPYSDFHEERVKEKVYQPNWTEPARLEYTLDLLDIISQLSKEGDEVSISTLPIAHRNAKLSWEQLQQGVTHLVAFVQAAVRLEKSHSIRVHLNLEPEPLCFLETSQDVVSFFKEYLLPLGVKDLQQSLSLSRSEAEACLLDKIRICYDTCHAAVLYEDPLEILNRYQALGIQIGKVQVSSALIYEESSYSLLEKLAQDKYCHQVVAKKVAGDGALEKFEDLPEVLELWRRNSNPPLKLSSEYRIHFHVPIFLEKFESLGTTQGHILKLIELAKSRFVTHHWEIETYTWPSWEGLMKNQSISEGIVEEINWFAEICGKKL